MQTRPPLRPVQMQSLTSCECTICPECFVQHFTIAVKEKHITDLVCPACDAPDLRHEPDRLAYFSTLDIQVPTTLWFLPKSPGALPVPPTPGYPYLIPGDPLRLPSPLPLLPCQFFSRKPLSIPQSR